MLVVGLHGWILPPLAIILCDLIVYSEFIIHPALLLSSSEDTRKKIIQVSFLLHSYIFIKEYDLFRKPGHSY